MVERNTQHSAAMDDIRVTRLAGRTVAEKINRERAVLLGWVPAVLLQVAHPLVAAGVADHSVALAQPRARVRRLRETLNAMLALTFGTPEEIARTTDSINQIHRRVNGPLREAAPGRPAGTRYSARDPILLLWVHATLLYQLPRAYELFVGPLAAEEKDRLCIEAQMVGIRLGIPRDDLPVSQAEVERYIDDMLANGTIAVGDTARSIMRELLFPRYLWFLWPLLWLGSLPAVGLLPPAMRRAYRLRWTGVHELALRLLAGTVRLVLPVTPAVVRYWPQARRATSR